MFEEYFFLFVTVLAIIYAILARVLQFKFGNQRDMEALNKETKEVNAAYKKAADEKNKEKMDLYMKKQQQLFPKMGKVMIGQFKVMAIVLVIFLGLTWVIGTINPYGADDITIHLFDNGLGCDVHAGDGIYSGCYNLTIGNPGQWTTTVNVYDDNNAILAQNSSSFSYIHSNKGQLYLPKKGKPVSVLFSKEVYSYGEQLSVYAVPSEELGNIDKVDATFNMGTWFYVDLPVTIPFLNISRIVQSYWWFILVSLLFGLVFSPIYKKYLSSVEERKMKSKSELDYEFVKNEGENNDNAKK